jgi:hypothetical protein
VHAYIDIDLVGSHVAHNIASTQGWGQGGRLFLDEYIDATLVNYVVVGNRASAGSGISIWDASPRLLHTTGARNGAAGLSTGSTGDGTRMYVTRHYGASTVEMTNTIVADQAVGIRVTVGNTVTLNGTLWHDNSGDWEREGRVTHFNGHFGDPALSADGYHLMAMSGAIDAGVDAGVGTDIGAEELAMHYVYLTSVLKGR